jgi:hypothetical protein
MAHKNNEENLIPFNQRTEEEQRAIATMGGIASGEARREKRAMRELLEIALAAKCVRGDLTNKEESAAQLAKKMAEGDLKAIEVGLKVIGEYEQKVKVEGDMRSVQVIVEDADTARKLSEIIGK